MEKGSLYSKLTICVKALNANDRSCLKAQLKGIIMLLIFLLLMMPFVLAGSFSTNAMNQPDTGKISQAMINFQAHLPEDRLYLHVDRTTYLAGETIWFTAFVRGTPYLQPSEKSEVVEVRLRNSNGIIVEMVRLITDDSTGVAQGDIVTKKDLEGGDYTLEAITNWGKNEINRLAVEQQLQILETSLPNVFMDFVFQDKSYQPGEEVNATLALRSPNFEPLTKHPFKGRVMAGNTTIQHLYDSTNSEGNAEIHFTLPKQLKNNEVYIHLETAIEFSRSALNDQSEQEKIIHRVPINTGRIEVNFFPEGGKLTAGSRQKVAFEAVDEFGNPADFNGVIYSSGGKLKDVKTLHEGIGSVTLPAITGEEYFLIIKDPPQSIDSVQSGMTWLQRTRDRIFCCKYYKKYPLPEVQPLQHDLTVSEVTEKYVELQISIPEDEQVTVVLQMFEIPYFEKQIDANKGNNSIKLPVTGLPSGVARIMLFDKDDNFKTERLVFVNRDRKLNIEVSTDKTNYEAGEKVRINIQTTDDQGLSIPAHVSVSVLNNEDYFGISSPTPISSRLLLEYETGILPNNPGFYFSDNPEAIIALDDFLLTANRQRFRPEVLLNDTLPEITHEPHRKILKGKVTDATGEPLKSAITQPGLPNFVQKGPGFYFYDEADQMKNQGYFPVKAQLSESVASLLDEGDSIIRTDSLNRFGNNLRIKFDNYIFRDDTLYGKVNNYPYKVIGKEYVSYNDSNKNYDKGILEGQVIDAQNNESIPFIIIALYLGDSMVMEVEGDIEGIFRLSGIAPGIYSVRPIYLGYSSAILRNINIEANHVKEIQVALIPAEFLFEPMEIQPRRPPYITIVNSSKPVEQTQKHLAIRNKEDLDRLIIRDMFYDQLRESYNERDKYYLQPRDFPVIRESDPKLRPTLHWEGHLHTGEEGNSSFYFYAPADLKGFSIRVEGIAARHGAHLAPASEVITY